MSSRKSVTMRVSPEFKKMIEEDISIRIKGGKGNPIKPPTTARTTLAYKRLLDSNPKLRKEVQVRDFT